MAEPNEPNSEPPKKARKRRTSNYLALKEIAIPGTIQLGQPLANPTAATPDTTAYEIAAEGVSVEACVKAITEPGKYLIVCVRRRTTAAVESVVKLT